MSKKKPDVEWCLQPSAEAVFNNEIEVWLCEECYEELNLEI